MTIERLENGQRFCRVLKHNGTVYLAGMTPFPVFKQKRHYQTYRCESYG